MSLKVGLLSPSCFQMALSEMDEQGAHILVKLSYNTLYCFWVSYRSKCHKSWQLNATGCNLHGESFTVAVAAQRAAVKLGPVTSETQSMHSDMVGTTSSGDCLAMAATWELVQKFRGRHTPKRETPSQVKPIYRSAFEITNFHIHNAAPVLDIFITLYMEQNNFHIHKCCPFYLHTHIYNILCHII